MRIESFKIENFRNLKLAQCISVPEFMVICGGNGCGKTALLEALMTAKERAGAYGNFKFDPRAVSVDSDMAVITTAVSFSDAEIEFVDRNFGETCPEKDEIIIEISKGGAGKPRKRSQSVHRLFSYYSRAAGSPGFFDYLSAQRQPQKVDLRNWDPSYLSDDTAKKTLAIGQQKFSMTKQYLAGLKMRDLQAIQTSQRDGNLTVPDSLHEVREVFNHFFAPLRFKDVYIDRSPFRFVVSTPLGDIDIDDMSSGEKEILNVFVRFHQLRPNGAVILLDEADSHLHPDLERRYLKQLRILARDNQLILTTHSPEMMIAAGSSALYTLRKEQEASKSNQLTRVTHSDRLHDVLSQVMGSRGLVSFNQRIIFIEGEEASADRAIYEAYYPPSKFNVSFVPAGNSMTVRKTAERVNELLGVSVGFQDYYSIVDRDVERAESDPSQGSHLFRLPVYHVENFLIDEQEFLEVTRSMLGESCPFNSEEEIRSRLQELLFSDVHLKRFTRALLDAKLATSANAAKDAIYKGSLDGVSDLSRPEFSEVESQARSIIQESIDDGTWKSKCKGRDLIAAYCAKIGANYTHFRNTLISRLDTPPQGLRQIMEQILR